MQHQPVAGQRQLSVSEVLPMRKSHAHFFLIWSCASITGYKTSTDSDEIRTDLLEFRSRLEGLVFVTMEPQRRMK
ncbi:unnamed protein product [Sphagnum jensenii]